MDYLQWIEEHREELVGFLSDLISYESVADPGQIPGETPNAAVLGCLEAALKKAREFGFHAQNFHDTAGLIDYIPSDSVPEIGVLCHLDVVPAGEGWDTPAFCAAVRDGVLYGRGATDDKGPFASALFALAALKATGVKLSRNVRLICGTCEETGSADIGFCQAKGVIPKTVFSPDADYPVVNTEKGMARFTLRTNLEDSAITAFSGGEVINMVAPNAGATVCGLDGARLTDALFKLDPELEASVSGDTVTVRGVPSHASVPDAGKNAIRALYSALLQVLPATDPAYPALCALHRLAPYGDTAGEGFRIETSDTVSGALTLNLGLSSLRDGVWELSFDVRFPLCETCEGLKEKLLTALENTPFTMERYDAVSPHHVPEDSELIRALIASYERFTGLRGKCFAIGGGTYVHSIDGGVAFGPGFPGEDNRIHCANEYVKIDHLILNAKIIASAILDLAN